eukprot:m.35715 g.35715  ORF g.35715 m.35715 type:complete len:121 (-) comp8932_c0_seq2:100-462(-)
MFKHCPIEIDSRAILRNNTKDYKRNWLRDVNETDSAELHITAQDISEGAQADPVQVTFEDLRYIFYVFGGLEVIIWLLAEAARVLAAIDTKNDKKSDKIVDEEEEEAAQKIKDLLLHGVR